MRISFGRASLLLLARGVALDDQVDRADAAAAGADAGRDDGDGHLHHHQVHRLPPLGLGDIHVDVDFVNEANYHEELHNHMEPLVHYDHDHHHHHDHGDVFEGCLLVCKRDIAARYGDEAADKMEADGFVFEECDDRGVESTSRAPGGLRGGGRDLGATNVASMLWNVPSLRRADGRIEVPYLIQSTSAFGAETLETIALAMETIESSTGVVKFSPRVAGQPQYVFFRYDSGIGCAANVGRGSPTSVYLGWCRYSQHLGSVIHEILHALGFWHEQSRPDRDDHVTIVWENIQSGRQYNFMKMSAVDSLESEYDYGSIMHYPRWAFSVDPGSRDTIVPTRQLGPGEVMGQRSRMSDSDIRQIRLLHQCASGPRRISEITTETLCSSDCRCWAYALGNCRGDDECMGDLRCGAPPSEIEGEVPERMCIPRGATIGPSGAPSASSSPSVGPSVSIGPTATISPTEGHTDNPTNELNTKWYIDWSISKCVKNCVGPAPCGGLGQWVTFHETMERCCDAHLAWMRTYDGCSTMPAPAEEPTSKPTDATERPSRIPTGSPTAPTTSPTKSPTGRPTASPSMAPSTSPTTAGPSSGPTTSPTDRPTTGPSIAPSTSPTTAGPSSGPTTSPTDEPTAGPTRGPSASPTTATPSSGPTGSPTGQPTTKSPTSSPTTANPTSHPSDSPTDAPATSSPTAMPSMAPTGAPIIATSTPTGENYSKWYVDWRISKCVKNCVGPAPCGGPGRWVTFHETMEQCCDAHLGWMGTYDGCSTMPAPTEVPTSKPTDATERPSRILTGSPTVPTTPTEAPTTQPSESPSRAPTASPTTGSPSASPTTAPPNVPPSQFPTDTPTTSQPTGDPSKRPTDAPNTLVWYPGSGSCLNDGRAPFWQNKYSSQATCCSSHFNWKYNDCMGILPTPSHKWYIDWGQSKCVQECFKNEGGSCGGLVPGSWITLHSTANGCCTAHLSYITLSDCVYTGDSTA